MPADTMTAYEIYVQSLGIETPADLRDYARTAPDLTVGTRSLLRFCADRWEEAKWVDWDEFDRARRKGRP